MSDIHTRRKLTRTATGAYLQYVDFDPTDWHRVRVELEHETLGSKLAFYQATAGGNNTTPAAITYMNWCDAHAPGYHYEYVYELEDGEYRNFVDVLFPPEAVDQAMLFKLTFG